MMPIASIISSTLRPLPANGTPTASNSSSSQPAPIPRMIRPSERTSAVDSIFAVSTGGRYGTTRTELSSFNFSVQPDRKISVERTSKQNPSLAAVSHLPPSL